MNDNVSLTFILLIIVVSAIAYLLGYSVFNDSSVYNENNIVLSPTKNINDQNTQKVFEKEKIIKTIPLLIAATSKNNNNISKEISAKNTDTNTSISSLFQEYQRSDLNAVMAKISKIRPIRARETTQKTFLYELGKRHGPSMSDELKRQTHQYDNFQRQFLSGWSSSEPIACTQWIIDNEDHAHESSDLFEELFRKIARKDQKAALKLLKPLKKMGWSEYAFKGILSTLNASEEFIEIIKKTNRKNEIYNYLNSAAPEQFYLLQLSLKDSTRRSVVSLSVHGHESLAWLVENSKDLDNESPYIMETFSRYGVENAANWFANNIDKFEDKTKIIDLFLQKLSSFKSFHHKEDVEGISNLLKTIDDKKVRITYAQKIIKYSKVADILKKENMKDQFFQNLK